MTVINGVNVDTEKVVSIGESMHTIAKSIYDHMDAIDKIMKLVPLSWSGKAYDELRKNYNEGDKDISKQKEKFKEEFRKYVEHLNNVALAYDNLEKKLNTDASEFTDQEKIAKAVTDVNDSITKAATNVNKKMTTKSTVKSQTQTKAKKLK